MTADSDAIAAVSARWLRWRWRGARVAALYGVLVPVALAAGIARMWRRRSSLVGLRDKLTGDGARLTPGPILIHGVSLGEVALMRPLVARLEDAFAQRGARPGFLLSTTTETGRQGLDRSFPGYERTFLPYDLPWAVTRFLTRTRPRAVLLLESEIWPLLLCACFARGIPVVLVNAKSSERSFRRFMLGGAATRALFGGVSLAIAQNAAYGARLRALGVPRVHVSGSMKADIVVTADRDAVMRERRRLGLGAEPILLIASTSGEEERALLTIWRDLGATWRLVICPRHPERAPQVVAWCADLGAASWRSTQGGTPAAGAVVIVDEIGRLGTLYALTADAPTPGIAVVGGSLGSGRGGQNMLEAAAAGCCTVVGWDTRNQPDSMAILRAHAGVIEMRPETMARTIAELAFDEARRRRTAAAGVRAWTSGVGASARAARMIVEELDRETPPRKSQ
ncbi:MAG: hypothetical protein H0V44_08565 [Planctomycetes bacterium]|nr:hypothetical protein [Planctomycetota bacterium]